MKITDHLGTEVDLPKSPQRIVSLVPSITELLHDLGLSGQVVGRTKFCIYPDKGFPIASIIGGTKNVHIDIVRDLNPDLVIANKEENVKDQVEAISKFTSTFTTVVKNRSDALKMILDIGNVCDKKDAAKDLIEKINLDFKPTENSKIKIVYLIWQNPYMTIGGDTYISNFLEDFGFENVYKAQNRYPSVELSEIVELKPNAILLSSEPFPFEEKHLREISASTGINTVLVDGSYCSWYGSRILPAQNYLRQLCNNLS